MVKWVGHWVGLGLVLVNSVLRLIEEYDSLLKQCQNKYAKKQANTYKQIYIYFVLTLLSPFSRVFDVLHILIFYVHRLPSLPSLLR